MMPDRLRLFRFSTALLYVGPLLAGLMGQGWAMVLAFVVVFLLWSVIVRAHLWPMTLADLGRSEAAVALASLVATQALLVIVCFAVGRGIGGVLALKPALPAVLPLALSVLSVPLSRLLSGPHGMVETAGFDPVWRDVTPAREGPQARVPAMMPEILAAEMLAAEMLAPIMALPDAVTEDLVQGHLTAISDHLDPVVIRKVLGCAVAEGRASRAAIKALIVHATDPATSGLMSGSAYPAQAFAAAGRDAELLGLFARRCIMALGDEPELVPDCPPAALVAQAARDCGDTVTASEMNRLAGLLG